VYAGIGSWQIDADSTIEKVREARRLGASGVVLFAYGNICGEGAKEDYVTRLKQEVFPDPASIPTIGSTGK
jgi:hypothetical protein